MRSEIVEIFEFPGEVVRYLRGHRADGRGGRTIRIATTPAVRLQLARHGLEAQSTLPYFGSDSHARTLRRSAEICDWLWARARFVDALGIHFAYEQSLVWHLRIFIHDLLWGIELLSEAIGRHDPAQIVTAAPDTSDPSGPLMHAGERYLGLLAERVAATRGIAVSFLAQDQKHRSVARRARSLAKLFRTAVVGPMLRPAHQRRLQQMAGEKPVIFTTDQYRMGRVASELRQNGLDRPMLLLRDWPSWISKRGSRHSLKSSPFTAQIGLGAFETGSGEDSRSRRSLQDALEALARQCEDHAAPFSYREVRFGDLAARKLRAGIRPFILGLHRRAAALHRILSLAGPAAVVSAGNRDEDVLIGELCRKIGIPAVMISHGSHVAPRNDLERAEWGEQAHRLIGAPYSFVALQSPLAETFLKACPTSSVPLRTGPIVWGGRVDEAQSLQLRQTLVPNETVRYVILHAGTPKRRGGIRFHVYETLDEYVQSITDLAEAVAQLPEVQLIVKFRPGPGLSCEDLRKLVPFSERVTLSVDEPFLEVLRFSSLLVSFSSTAIEEALQIGIPVLLYGGRGRYRHVSAEEVKPDLLCPLAAAYAVRQPEHLPDALRRILESHRAAGSREEIFGPYRFQERERISLVRAIRTGVWTATQGGQA